MSNRPLAVAVVPLSLAASTAFATPAWAVGQPSREARSAAVQRGLWFIYRLALDKENFASFATDFLWCFYTISVTSADPAIRKLAREMGRRMGLRFRRWWPRLPPGTDAEWTGELMMGVYAMERLGLQHRLLRADLEAASKRMTPQQYLGFDPRREAPPLDIPDECATCGAYNQRGDRWCRRCGHELDPATPLDVFCDALIGSYFLDHFGARFGVRYRYSLRWLPKARERYWDKVDKNGLIDRLNVVTHVLYTLSDYGALKLDPRWVEPEYRFLLENYERVLALDDPEMIAETTDCLKLLGHSEDDPRIVRAHAYLLSRQKPDGSWRNPDGDDDYDQYHTTWTAIDGLREYGPRRVALAFPEVQADLEAWARERKTTR